MTAVGQDDRARYRQLRARRLGPLPRRALAWCALAPGWPEEVVEQISSLSADVPLDTAVLSSAVDGDVLERLPGTSPWDRPFYRMSTALREPAVEELTESYATETGRRGAGLDSLRREVVAAGAAMLTSAKVPYDPVLYRWARLAEQAGSDLALGQFLDARVTEALDAARQTGSLAAPEALRWIEAVEPLAQLFKGTLDAAVAVARGKRELFYRRADDERRLINYYPPPASSPRPPREQAFHELLADPEHWALHYVGGGGGGKTMLLRYIASRLAPAAGAAVARVDFDFLNPDYPFREPGMLLARFAEELRLQTGTEQAAFSSFDSALTDLNIWIAHERSEGREGLVTVADERFARVIDAFARACRRLERPVVLMLDTCEELAKLRGDKVPENVQVTFDVLNALREEDRMGSRLRVIFSGRRAVAAAGYGWTAPESPLPPRTFLRLFRVGGFSEAEARGFLSTYRAEGRSVRADLHAHILRLSPAEDEDDDATARFLPADRDDSPRYNPYDIDMYAEWATSAEAREPLTPERLEKAGPHFYIEERIANRLGTDLRRLLPALALLGRFDRQLLEKLVAWSTRAAALIVEITEQEWIRPDRSAAGDKWLIDEGLRNRLLRYFYEKRDADLDAGRRLLAAVLPELTLERPFTELNERYFAATFEALRDQPERAAEWWMQVENRILATGAWRNWAQPLAAALLADPVMSSERRASFRPAVLALQAAALLHADGTVSAGTWQQVNDCIDAYPAVLGRARLRYRLECALKSVKGSPDLGGVPDAADPQCWGALAAAMEAAVERAELDSLPPSTSPIRPELGRWGPNTNLLASAPDTYIRAFGLLLRARITGIQGLRPSVIRANPIQDATDAFVEAASLAAAATPSRWLDWIGPDDLHSRILLEGIRTLGREPPLPSGVAFASGIDGIDSDRLRAARLRLSDADIPQRDVMAGISPMSKPRCRAHRETPPYDVVAHEIIGRARPLAAIDGLKEISQRATATGLPDVALQADRAIARTIRRQRLLSEGWPLPASVVASQDPGDVRLRVVTRALHVSGETAARAVADLPSPDPVRRGAGRRADAEAILEWAETAQLKGDDVKILFDEATSLFEQVGDGSGVLRARIAGALWLAREGKPSEPTKTVSLDRLPLPGAAAWPSVERRAAMPSQDDAASVMTIADAAKSPSILELLDRLDADWRPWAVRALAAALAVAGEQASAQRNALVRWVREHYTTEIDGARHLPYELAFIDSSVQVPARGRARGWQQVGTAAAFIVGALMLTGLVYGSWQLTTSIAPNWPVALRAIAAVLLLPASVWLIGRGLPMIGRWYRSAVAAFISVTFNISMPGRPDDLNRPLKVPWSLLRRTRIFFVEIASPRGTMPGTDQEQYRLLATSMGMGGTPRDWRLLRLFRIVVDVKTVIPPFAAAAPWEAVFGMPSADITRLDSSSVHIYRSLTAHRTPPQPDWQGIVVVTTWLAPGIHIGRSDTGWAPNLTSASEFITFETASSPREYEEERPQTGVLHVIGTPVERRGDVHLQIGGLEKGTDSPYLLAADDLVRRYGALRLLVIQATPSGAVGRTVTDRLEAAYLKRIGAAAFQAGVPAVLLVPPVPPVLTSHFTFVLFEVLRRSPRNATRPLIAAHRRIQQLVATAWSGPPDEQLDIALDTCLYVADRVNFHVRRDVRQPSTTSSAEGVSR